MKRYAFLVLIILYHFQFLVSQDPARFQSEIDSLRRLQIENPESKEILLFTGSSSIRMWKDVQEYFPDYYVINTGFGGSHMSDLLFYLEDLVLQYHPDQVFIYEGDNDVSDGKKAGRIRREARKLVEGITLSNPGAYISFISPKPSLARWDLRSQYNKVNKSLSAYAASNDGIEFIDVWGVMLNPQGTPRTDVFLEDGLHMNKTGYDIWSGEIIKYVK